MPMFPPHAAGHEAGAEASLLDAPTLARLFDLDLDGRLLPRVVAAMDATLQRQLPRLERALTALDRGEIAAVLHQFKSAAASIGALAPAADCAGLEQRLHHGHPLDELVSGLQQLAADLRAARQALAHEVLTRVAAR